MILANLNVTPIVYQFVPNITKFSLKEGITSKEFLIFSRDFSSDVELVLENALRQPSPHSPEDGKFL